MNTQDAEQLAKDSGFDNSDEAFMSAFVEPARNTQDIRTLIVEGGYRTDTNVGLDRLIALIDSHVKRARIEELETLSHQKWSDIDYDIPGYLKDRINTLTKELKGE